MQDNIFILKHEEVQKRRFPRQLLRTVRPLYDGNRRTALVSCCACIGTGSGFYYFVIDRDEEEIAALAKAEKEFWSNVTTKTPPLADGMKATSEAIKAMFPESSDKSVDLFGYDSEMERYTALTRQIKELEVQKEESANILKAFLEDAERGESEKYKILYKTQIRQSFDLKKFAAEHSDIDLSLYYKYSSARTFKVVEKNKEN